MKIEMQQLLNEFIEGDFTTHEMRVIMEALDDLTELKRAVYSQTVRDYSERNWNNYEEAKIEAQRWLDSYGITFKIDDLV